MTNGKTVAQAILKSAKKTALKKTKRKVAAKSKKASSKTGDGAYNEILIILIAVFAAILIKIFYF